MWARIGVWLTLICISPAFTASNLLCFQNPQPSPPPMAHLFPSATVSSSSSSHQLSHPNVFVLGKRVSRSWISGFLMRKALFPHLLDCLMWEVASDKTQSVASFFGDFISCHINLDVFDELDRESLLSLSADTCSTTFFDLILNLFWYISKPSNPLI